MTAPERPVPVNMGELGRTGLRQWYGTIDEEFLPQLKTWTQRIKVYREMAENDPTVGALLYVVKTLVRQVNWFVDADAEDEERRDCIQRAMDDVRPGWKDTVSEITGTMLTYGFAPHELVYLRREDGSVGWKKLPVRHPDTLSRWLYDEQNPNELLGMEQQSPPDWKTIKLPLAKLLLFRTESGKDSPEGRSLLRNAYRPWYFKKHIENVEAIGIERDLAGLPVVWGPAEIFTSDASAAEQEVAEKLKQMARDVRNDEQGGIALPMAYDEHGNELYGIKLLASAGQKQINTNEIVDRYAKAILTTALADFLMMGQEKVGSFALAGSKTGVFTMSCGALLDQILAPFNDKAIPELLELNGLDPEDPPQLKCGDIELPDFAEVAQLLTGATSAGWAPFPDFELENKLRQMLGLKPLEQDEWEQKETEREEAAEQDMRQALDMAQAGKPGEEDEKPADDEKPKGDE